MILRELVLRLIYAGKHRRALDELDLYLPLFPFHDNPVMHVYAGLLALYLAQPLQATPSGTPQGSQSVTAFNDRPLPMSFDGQGNNGMQVSSARRVPTSNALNGSTLTMWSRRDCSNG